MTAPQFPFAPASKRMCVVFRFRSEYGRRKAEGDYGDFSATIAPADITREPQIQGTGQRSCSRATDTDIANMSHRLASATHLPFVANFAFPAQPTCHRAGARTGRRREAGKILPGDRMTTCSSQRMEHTGLTQ